MANMYIRVPHYVASFYRNRDQHHPKKVGEPVSVENEPVLWDMLMHFITPNPYEKIVKDGCFCERMWRKMMRGQRLDGSNTRIKRNYKEPLTDAEVRDLCSLSAATHEDTDEYLCIALPEYVFREGRQQLIDGQYQMTTVCYKRFVAEMRRRFWAECIGYIDSFIEVDKQKGYDRNMMEGMDRFMIRYDIQSGERNKYRKTMKRNYYRQLKYQQHRQYDFVEHGEF